MSVLRVAIVGGAGFMGKAHSMAWSLASLDAPEDAEIEKAVLVEPDSATAASSAKRLGWAESATSWREVLERDDIDIVDIVTPPQFHREIALAAVRSGKHVFCEKPLSNSIDEALEMADAVANSGVTAQAGFNYRHTSAIAYSRQLIEDGRLGRVLQFRGSYLNESSFTGAPDRWRARRSSGGSGSVGDIGSHVIDIAQYLVGDIVRVCALVRARSSIATGGPWRDERDRLAEPDLIDDGGLWLAEFDSGAIGTFAVCSLASGRKNRLSFELDGEEGAVEFDWNRRDSFRVSYRDDPIDHSGFREVYTNLQHPNGWWRLAGLGVGYADVSAIQLQAFVANILGADRAVPTFADAAQVQRVVDSVYESARSGGWVEVPGRRIE